MTVIEFCCKANALWVVGGIALVPLETLLGLLIYPLAKTCKCKSSSR